MKKECLQSWIAVTYDVQVKIEEGLQSGQGLGRCWRYQASFARSAAIHTFFPPRKLGVANWIS